MIKEILFPLKLNVGRPLIVLKEAHNLTALIDTGASIPVWTAAEELLGNYYNAKLIQKSVTFSGFGGTTEGNLYRIDFRFGDICYPELPIVTGKEFATAPFDMIISATMLEDFVYQIDTVKKTMLVQGDEALFQGKRITIDGKVLMN